MKKRILIFLAGLVSAVAVGFYLWLKYKSISQTAEEEVVNKPMKDAVTTTEEDFRKIVEKKRKEIQNAKTEEITAKVHSFFGLDS